MLTEIDTIYRNLPLPRNQLQARIAIFDMIRDIPYAVIPELNSYHSYTHILEHNKGSCMPKHLLLCELFQKLGLNVLYAVYPFQWKDFNCLYPAKLRKLADTLPLSYHLSCRLNIEDSHVLVDATLDSGLEKTGLIVNNKWDGVSNTVLPVRPCGEEVLYHPSEAYVMEGRKYDDNELEFFSKLNVWLQEGRLK